MILAIDLGLRTCGVTLAFLDGYAQDAWLARSSARARVCEGERIPAITGPLAWKAMAAAVYGGLRQRSCLESITVLALEYPYVYRQRQVQQRAVPGKDGRTTYEKDTNDLLDLAAVAGAIVTSLHTVTPALARFELVRPAEWKRSYPKKDFEAALFASFTDAEKSILSRTPTSLRGHVTESAGLARYVATLLTGAPVVAPTLQRRAREGRQDAATPAWKTPLEPAPGGETFGVRHGLVPARTTRKADFRTLATSATHRPGRDQP